MREEYSVFLRQAHFIKVTEQHPTPELYAELMREEYDHEFKAAWSAYRADPNVNTLAEVVDACIDFIYVTAGFVNSIEIAGDMVMEWFIQEHDSRKRVFDVFKIHARTVSDIGQGMNLSLMATNYHDRFLPALARFNEHADHGFSERLELARLCVAMIYYTAGLIACLGINGDAAFTEVHRSNMSKVAPDGKVIKRGDGKILKPATYSPPDLVSVVRDSLDEIMKNKKWGEA